MEEGHLHHGINTCRQSAFAGDFSRVNHKEPRFFLVQHRLNFLRQTCPDFICVVRRIEQENTAWFQTFRHLILINKLQLVAADKISLRHQVSGTNRLLADAQVRDRQAASFLRVIDEVTLCIPRCGVTNNLDVVFGCRNAAVAAQTVK